MSIKERNIKAARYLHKVNPWRYLLQYENLELKLYHRVTDLNGYDKWEEIKLKGE